MSTLSDRQFLVLKQHTIWLTYSVWFCWLAILFYSIFCIYHLLKLDVLGVVNSIYFGTSAVIFIVLKKHMLTSARSVSVINKNNYQEVSYQALISLGKFFKIFIISFFLTSLFQIILQTLVAPLASDWQYGDVRPAQSSSSSSKTWECDVDCVNYKDQ